jgi:hypothetical protein
MNYQSYDLGYRKRGEIAQITIQGNAANVKLMDSSNFQSYKSGRQHRFYGGQARRSPVNIPIPHSGQWYVAIDFGGYPGKARTGVQVLPGRLPEIRDTPLSAVPSLVQSGGRSLDSAIPGAEDDIEKEYDIFISHASEDKDAVVRPLAHALQDSGLKVWYDEFELRIGDSLRRKIDKGLANSRFGVVVLSQSFFAKGWTNYELDGLVTRAVSGEQVILPIWHNVSKQEVIQYSPSLADKLARNTAIYTVDEIAAEISDLILESASTSG